MSTLIADTNMALRVEFDLTSDGVPQGTVVWRQALGARRLDFSFSAPEPHGAFEIETKFSANSVPREGSACNWVVRDANVLLVNCGVSLNAGEIADDLRSTIVVGVSDHRLPTRSVLGVSTECYGVKMGAVIPAGEVCLEPTRQIPLYYANGLGAVLKASKYAVDSGESAFSTDLATRLSDTTYATPASVSRSDLELP